MSGFVHGGSDHVVAPGTCKATTAPVLEKTFGTTHEYKNPLTRAFNAITLVGSYILFFGIPVFAMYVSTMSWNSKEPVTCDITFGVPLRCTPTDACMWQGMKCVNR